MSKNDPSSTVHDEIGITSATGVGGRLRQLMSFETCIQVSKESLAVGHTKEGMLLEELTSAGVFVAIRSICRSVFFDGLNPSASFIAYFLANIVGGLTWLYARRLWCTKTWVRETSKVNFP